MTHRTAKETEQAAGQTFWEHLDELRSVLISAAIATLLCSVVAFLFKEELFGLILAPKHSDFITYRLLGLVANRGAAPLISPDAFSIQLINTGLATQFVMHMKAALYAGVFCASPYILYQLFRFVSPALYAREKRYATRTVAGGYIMFLSGAALCYLLIFPLTFRFLGTYQVSGEVTNMISLESYMDTLMMMTLLMGIVFEIPILCWLLTKSGFLTSTFMRRYRRHATVLILIIAAIITPTSDVFTLLAVALPMYLLYEISILIAGRTAHRRAKS